MIAMNAGEAASLPAGKVEELHPHEWTARPLVGVVLEVNDDASLRIRIAAQVDELVHVYGEGMVATGHHDDALGVRVYRVAGIRRGRPTQTDLRELSAWLVGKEVRLYVGMAFSADTFPEPVPAVIHDRSSDVLINDQVIQRGLGELWDDEPGALGEYDWQLMVVAAERSKSAR